VLVKIPLKCRPTEIFNSLTNSYTSECKNFVKFELLVGLENELVTLSLQICSSQRMLAVRVIVEPEMCWSRFYEAFGFQYDTTSQLMVKLAPWVCKDKDV
jgi:hypothetical protein